MVADYYSPSYALNPDVDCAAFKEQSMQLNCEETKRLIMLSKVHPRFYDYCFSFEINGVLYYLFFRFGQELTVDEESGSSLNKYSMLSEQICSFIESHFNGQSSGTGREAYELTKFIRNLMVTLSDYERNLGRQRCQTWNDNAKPANRQRAGEYEFSEAA